MLRYLSKSSEKVVFLNDKNVEVLKGYKAYVQVNRQGEIHIIIAGLSKDSSKTLFDNLEALNTADTITDDE
jgi:sortase (surface protein transpeptidase)